MFNVLRLVPLALFIASASSTTLNAPRAPSSNGPLAVARAPVAPIEETISYSVRETNAKRMARGLGPATPNFERATILPGRRHIPTRMGSARRATPSGSAGIQSIIKVTRADNGGLVGYVNEAYVNPSTRRYGITASTTDALQVTAFMKQNAYTTIDLQEHIPTDPAHPLLGAVVGPASSDDNLSSGSPNYLILTGTSHTDANAPPSPAGNSYSGQNSESAIWTYSTSTQKITAQWVNTDNSKPATFLYYLAGSDGLLLVGDPTAFNDAFPGGYAVPRLLDIALCTPSIWNICVAPYADGLDLYQHYLERCGDIPISVKVEIPYEDRHTTDDCDNNFPYEETYDYHLELVSDVYQHYAQWRVAELCMNLQDANLLGPYIQESESLLESLTLVNNGPARSAIQGLFHDAPH
ncbi:hypothetical protein CPB85DRAFT_1562067 [Mucidula mucida]|nr:hypothetical protein CPB85DRAFT_1562067 [Mucidula mucida]